MNTATSQSPKRFAIAAGGLTSLTGVVVLFGWALDIVALKQFASGGTTMAPVTALCFVLAGIALWCAAGGACPGNLAIPACVNLF